MSTIKVNSIQNTSGVEVYTAKAWVNFNGNETVAINASGNVSSVTDNGTGDYTINFTSPLADANYCWAGSCRNSTDQATAIGTIGQYNTAYIKTTGQLRVRTTYSTGGTSQQLDSTDISVVIFR